MLPPPQMCSAHFLLLVPVALDWGFISWCQACVGVSPNYTYPFALIGNYLRLEIMASLYSSYSSYLKYL